MPEWYDGATNRLKNSIGTGTNMILHFLFPLHSNTL